jgi:hypothetical protein
MRFRQGYSGGAAPDFHRFPVTETIVLFFFSSAILPLAPIKINRGPVFVAGAGKQHISDYM